MHDVCQKGDMGWMWRSNPIFRGKEDPSSLDVAVNKYRPSHSFWAGVASEIKIRISGT
jgi:hypothetical protein